MTTNQHIESIKQRNMTGLLIANKPYPGELPADIAPWHCYTVDGGHTIMVCLAEYYRDEEDDSYKLEDYLITAPVKTVLRVGYEMKSGKVYGSEVRFPVANIEYSPELGLITPDEDDEF